MMDSELLKKSRSAAYRYLSYRARSYSETQDHLTQKDYPVSIVNRTLSDLVKYGYINDEKFALDRGRSRIANKKFGPYRLKQDLLGKGISRELVDQTLTRLYAEVDEEELAKLAAEKKVHQLRGVDAKVKRRRLIQFLQRKGFSSDIIFKTVHQLVSESA
jgi:regulatory protein